VVREASLVSSRFRRESTILILYSSPYCGHCIHVKPIYQTLYEFYYTSNPTDNTASTSLNTFTAYYNYHFGALDCIAFGDACSEHGVSLYPTFVLYHDGEEQKRYEGSHDIRGLSDMVEETLETIKPGSRPIGGPSLPKTGDSSTSDYIASSMTPSSADEKEKVLSPKANEDKEARPTQAKKASKPTPTPNPLGASVPLTAEKFQSLVTMTRDPWFIKFYAPWCGHCQAMAPNWVQLSKEMEGRLNIGEVNCDAEPRLCKDVKLRGYPTILFFQGGERVEYEGLRGLGDFISYANKAIDIGEGVKDVDKAQFEELEEKEEVIFLYFYDHATTAEDFQALERLTLSLVGHAKLVKTKSPELAERFKITTFPRLLVSRDGLPTYYTALAPQDMRDFRQVLHWMKSVWLPIVPELTASNSRDIMDGRLVVLGILSRERPDDFVIAKKELKNAAIEWIDKETTNFQRERQELRDAKQLRIEEAEDRNDQRALRAAKSIRISMDKSNHKEVGFAWVDGVFWERWIRQTYGIDVGRDGEKVIINDEDVCPAFPSPKSSL
jgi:protein disulfide-isomerase